MNTTSAPLLNPLPLEIDPQRFPGFTIVRPDLDLVLKTKEIAREIFKEAFTSTYTEYHKQSGSQDSIEAWLKISGGRSVDQWLSETFDEELKEFEQEKKFFIYLVNTEKELLGWLSHSPVSEDGDLYLSQCCLRAEWRRKKVASTAFSRVIKTTEELLFRLFPSIKEVKLIARKINLAAHGLYTGAGFTVDPKIDPKVYGGSYDDRYVGYRLTASSRKI